MIKTQVVSIMGVGRGVGTTHFSVMTGNYFANCLGQKTAVVEYNEHNDFIKIRKEIGQKCETIKLFTYCGIDFLKAKDFNGLSEIMFRGYDVIIIDMEYLCDKSYEEFLRSDTKIVVGSLEFWKIYDLKKYLYNNQKTLNKTAYKVISLSNGMKNVKEIKKQFKVTVFQMPKESDPFLISPESIRWFNKFFR